MVAVSSSRREPDHDLLLAREFPEIVPLRELAFIYRCVPRQVRPVGSVVVGEVRMPEYLEDLCGEIACLDLGDDGLRIFHFGGVLLVRIVGFVNQRVQIDVVGAGGVVGVLAASLFDHEVEELGSLLVVAIESGDELGVSVWGVGVAMLAQCEFSERLLVDRIRSRLGDLQRDHEPADRGQHEQQNDKEERDGCSPGARRLAAAGRL